MWRRGAPSSGHELIEHPADLGIHAWGPTVECALEEAGLALSEVLDVRTDRVGSTERIGLERADLGALTVDLLNELVFLVETRDQGIRDVRVRAEAGRSVAEVDFGPFDHRSEGTAVKAATYHRLSAREEPEGSVDLQVFLDV